MREIITPFDATLRQGLDTVTGLQGIVLESRGGTAQSNNYRNPEHAKLLRFVLEKLQIRKCKSVRFYVAANSPVYTSSKSRLLVVNGNDEFSFVDIDLDTFEKQLKNAIKISGQKEGTAGGNSTKRLMITSSGDSTDWNQILM